MSHLGPGQRAAKHRRSACRKGRHRYGEEQSVGAGILRRICATCGSVSIDLTGAHELTSPGLPSERGGDSPRNR